MRVVFPLDGKPADERLSLQKVKDAARNVLKAFWVVWDAHHASTLAMAACTLVGALIPAGQAWVGKLIVDAVVNSAGAGLPAVEGLRVVTPFLVTEFVLLVVQAGVTQGRSLAEHMLHARLNLAVNTRIIQKALELDLSYFENAEFYDKLQNARREADWRGLQIVNGGFYLVQNVITMVSFAALLVRFSPWLAVVIFAATLPAFLAQSHFSEMRFRMLSWRAPEARKLNYYEYLLTVDDSAKEVKLFNIGKSLLARYAALFWKTLKEDQDLATKRSLASFGLGLIATMTYYGSYAWIVFRAFGQTISLGDVTLKLSIFRGSQTTFETIFFGLNNLYENGLFMSNLFAFLELKPRMPVAAHPVPVPSPLTQGIEFKDVWFKYPDREDWALKGVSLKILPGEKIALVGPNGAGKTTLIKLLTRLYDPDRGQICLDGVDLRDYDPTGLRQRIGVIFQDFVRYHFTAGDNVGLGQIEAIDDQERIIGAAHKGGAHTVIDALPQKYQTMLGRWVEKGHELSGGEWQKVALARAFMRECEILVLDEPTASLDAENELAVFQRFRELTVGKMAILISHRFSTVRMADRIFVIENGEITERGSHQELLALAGTYARLFTMQAESYK